ncbi:MAG: dihydropteroate synthase [Gammaproteobacteria bacterium]
MKVMGILNVTPDSFSDGGLYRTVDQACFHAEKMIQEGADILDIGGESTRPCAIPVSVQEELDRVIPVIEKLHQTFNIPLSIDTLKPAVMQAALSAGVWMINDVNALQAEGALDVAVSREVKICLMHKQGEPRTMQVAPHYEDVVQEVTNFLLARKQICINAGIPSERIFLDPGIGFGKNLEHNVALLKNLDKLPGPILLGVSRKAMLGTLLNLPENQKYQRLPGSVALAVWAAIKNVAIIRVHDVKETVQALTVIEAVL